MGEIPFYILALKEELQARIKRNPRYSLRAFAMALNIDASYLSRCFSFKQVMSLEIAEGVIKKLQMNSSQRELFLHSIAAQQTCTSLHKHDKHLTACEK
ncbi:MAG: hypothetical protein A2103_01355 [Gammaproteobacteria bacterium GWF2_41_13]|nr:MAG: hypothetical protein A2103_01355 [Gammaproteobacteria bacterium GWF2_41_13]